MFTNFTWRDIWLLPETGRLRSGWRIAVFGLLAAIFAGLLNEFFNLLLKILQKPFLTTPTILYALNEFCVLLAVFAVAVWALRTFELLPPRTLGVSLEKSATKRFFLGTALGLGMIICYCLLAFCTGSSSWQLLPITNNQLFILLFSLGFYLLIALKEEMVFRGYGFQTMLRGIGPLPTLVISSIAFAYIHHDNIGITPLAYANIGIAGIFLGLLYLRTGSLWASIGFHLGWNYAQVLFNLSVSGNTNVAASPINLVTRNQQWSTLLAGGDFGPEGGLLVTVILLAAVAVITRGPWGIPLDSEWWRWPEATIKMKKPVAWDFIIGKSHFQWKLPTQRDDN